MILDEEPAGLRQEYDKPPTARSSHRPKTPAFRDFRDEVINITRNEEQLTRPTRLARGIPGRLAESQAECPSHTQMRLLA